MPEPKPVNTYRHIPISGLTGEELVASRVVAERDLARLVDRAVAGAGCGGILVLSLFLAVAVVQAGLARACCARANARNGTADLVGVDGASAIARGRFHEIRQGDPEPGLTNGAEVPQPQFDASHTQRTDY